METLKEIRKRLHAVENIKQITKTMEMVAGARLRRAQAKAEQSRPYAEKIKMVLEHVAQSGFTHPLFEVREVKKIGLVIVAADRGLCGAYNSHIFQKAEQFLHKHANEEVELFLIGRKAVDHYHNKKWKIKTKIPRWGGKITVQESNSFAHEVMESFLNDELDEVWLVYTQFISVFQRQVMVEKFLNVQRQEVEKTQYVQDYIFEPDPAEILYDLLPRYGEVKIHSILAEAYASELAARVVSMKAATKNAEEMIENLTLVRNKIRQSGITKEMLEIISGAEFLY